MFIVLQQFTQDSTTINYSNESGSTEPLQPQLSLNSPPSQSSTLKLGSDVRRSYQTPPLLYDALNRHDISRYDPLGLNMNYGGSNATLSSGGSGTTPSINNNHTSHSTSLSNGPSIYTHHHTLPNPASTSLTSRVLLPHTHSNLGTTTEPLSIANYLAETESGSHHLTLPKSLGPGPGTALVLGGIILPVVTTAVSLANANLTTINSTNNNISMSGSSSSTSGNSTSCTTINASSAILTPVGVAGTTLSTVGNMAFTHKSNQSATRNHIITDTLPGPESCV